MNACGKPVLKYKSYKRQKFKSFKISKRFRLKTISGIKLSRRAFNFSVPYGNNLTTLNRMLGGIILSLMMVFKRKRFGYFKTVKLYYALLIKFLPLLITKKYVLEFS